MKMTDKIRRLLKKGMTAQEIGLKLNVPPSRVHTVKWLDKKKKKPSKIVEAAQITKAELKALLPKPDPVNHPPHYKAGGIETIDFIEAKDLNYRLGNVIKYVSRAGRKDSDPIEDLEKAAWYLNREIAARKRA